MPHIYTEFDSGVEHQINLRLYEATQIDFISFSETTSSTEIYIDAERMEVREYELVLESFNVLSPT